MAENMPKDIVDHTTKPSRVLRQWRGRSRIIAAHRRYFWSGKVTSLSLHCLAKAFGSATNMVATSLDSKAYLRSSYRNAVDNIFLLRMRGCKVYHEVDATDMKNHKMIKGLRFDRIIYNFPHAGDFKSTKIALRNNQRLVRLFMENCVKLIEEKGEIHIRHKSTWFFRQWNLEGLASEAGMVLIEEAPFDISEFKGYNTKYGFEGAQFRSDYNFDCHSSCTYKFVLSEWQKKLRRQNS